MGYYCTVPQCTSLAGKTKNVKFHRFPRDESMADKWNIILKRGKPYTKYSKVCSLHFTQADYNVTTMGQWKTLNKEAVPSQNLPRLNPDGTVMVIRKSRTIKYKDSKKDDVVMDKSSDKWPHTMAAGGVVDISHTETHDPSLSYRLQTLTAMANNVSPTQPIEVNPNQPRIHNPVPLKLGNPTLKPLKQDAIMQTDPVKSEDDDTQPNGYDTEPFTPDTAEYPVPYEKDADFDNRSQNYEMPKDYTKSNEDYMPQTNEEDEREAEKYALGRKSHNGYEKPVLDTGYPKPVDAGYKVPDVYAFSDKPDYPRDYPVYGYPDSADVLRNQQHNLQILQEQHRNAENQNFFNENHIKQENDVGNDKDKFMYDRAKEQLEANQIYGEPRRMHQHRLMSSYDHIQQVKQEPETNGHDNVMQPQGSPYYSANGHNGIPGGYYEPRPGAEMLIAKQNALAAHTQLWQNTMKRPFFYSDNPHYGTPTVHRFEDLTRILQ